MNNDSKKSAEFSKIRDAGKSGLAGSKTMARSEISAKWPKFTASDLSGLKNKDDLITQVVSKYAMEKPQAQREVEALMNGRHFE